MIRLYSGTPGSGKSLHNARDVINRSRFGKPVIGNFECDLSKYKKANYTYVPNHEITPKYLIAYSRTFFAGKKIKEGAILLVLDECQLLFNARDWQQKGRNDWLSFFTQHRKFGYDITLIAQFDRMIDRQIRSLVEYEYIHRKMSNFGIAGKIMSLLLGGNTFIAVQMWYPLKLKVGSELFHARKSLYSIYDSYGTFDVSPTQVQKKEKSATLPHEGERITVDETPKEPEKQDSPQELSVPKRQHKGKYLKRPALSWNPFRRTFPEGRDEFGWKKTT